jgi:hypothetical protein
MATIQAVRLVDLNGNPYVASGGGSGGGGAVTVADGADVAQGAIADAAVVTNAAGSVSAKLRGIVALLAGTLTTTLVAGASAGVTTASSNVSATGTVTASAYSAGNGVGGLLTFPLALRAATLSGLVDSITVQFKSVQAGIGMKLYLLNANPTASTFTDKTAPAIAAADIGKVISVWTLGTVDSGLGTCSIWTLEGIGRAIVAAGTTLYGVLVTTGALTPTSTSDLVGVTIGILQD